MTNEPPSLRAHLLKAQPLDPGRQQLLEKELQAMIENRLTRKARIGWTVSLIAAALFAAWGVLQAVTAPVDPPLRAIWWIYAGANFLWAGYVVHILRIGRFDLRLLEHAIACIAAIALLITGILFWRAAVNPTLANLLWAMFGILCVTIDFFWMLHHRIRAGEWAAKENTLRLQLLLIEIREKIAAKNG